MKLTVNKQSGAVSLFIVIFACLLVTIVTIGFVAVMVKNQQQVASADLSQSAYDSAMAGVEDAKRLVLIHRGCEDAGDTTSAKCAAAKSAIDADDCDTIQSGLLPVSPGNEVKIKNGSGDTASDALDQAYTCVKVTYDTLDVKRQVKEGDTQMVPLRAKDGATYNRVKVSWFQRPQGVTTSLSPRLTVALDTKAAWGASSSILRTQFMQTAPSFNQTQFDATTGGESNTNTVFLYPLGDSAAATASTPVTLTSADVRPNTTPRTPQPISCSNAAYTGGGYACSALLTIPNPIGGNAANRSNAFLLVSAIYHDTDYKIELFNGTTPVPFDGVQPKVDATGRANDLFRRVDARIELNSSSFVYPGAAVDITGDLCKAFSVTDDVSDYEAGPCTP